MKINPRIEETPEIQINQAYENNRPDESIFNEILSAAGVIDEKPKESDDPNSALRKHLNSLGGRLEDVAKQLVDVMCRGESESARISAAKFIAEIQEVKTRIENEAPKAVPVQINIIGSENKNLIQLVMPKS